MQTWGSGGDPEMGAEPRSGLGLPRVGARQSRSWGGAVRRQKRAESLILPRLVEDDFVFSQKELLPYRPLPENF